MGVGGQRHAPAALSPGNTQYSLYRRLGGPGDRSSRMWKISSPLGFDTRSVLPVARRYTDWAIPAQQWYGLQICSSFKSQRLNRKALLKERPLKENSQKVDLTCWVPFDNNLGTAPWNNLPYQSSFAAARKVQWSYPCAGHKRIRWWGVAPLIPTLDTSWGWPLYPWVQSPRYPFRRRPDKPPKRAGSFGERGMFPLPGNEPRFLCCPSPSLKHWTDCAIPAVTSYGWRVKFL